MQSVHGELLLPTPDFSWNLKKAAIQQNWEQGVILQPLIYNDPAFASWVQKQRAWYAEWASPNLELVFTHQCQNPHVEVKSVAPKETELENFASRMNWINQAASMFHNLMQQKKAFMHSALSNIASWVDLADAVEEANSKPGKRHEF